MSELDIWEDDDGVERIGCTWCGGDGFEGVVNDVVHGNHVTDRLVTQSTEAERS